MRKRCKDHDEDEDELLDFEDSADDYEPSDSEVDVDSVSSSSSEDENVIQPTAKPAALKTLPDRRTRFSTRQQQDLVFESDKYFSHTNRKVETRSLRMVEEFNFCLYFIHCRMPHRITHWMH